MIILFIFAPCLTNLIMFMKQTVEVIVDYPTMVTGQFQCKLKQSFEIDNSIEIPFNQLYSSLKLIFGEKAIISFRMF